MRTSLILFMTLLTVSVFGQTLNARFDSRSTAEHAISAIQVNLVAGVADLGTSTLRFTVSSSRIVGIETAVMAPAFSTYSITQITYNSGTQEVEIIITEPASSPTQLNTTFQDLIIIEYTTTPGTTMADLNNSTWTTQDLTSYGGGTMNQGTFSDQVNAPLPVTWLSFTARTENNKALLQWSTATELNADVFIVEKKIGNSEWNAIGSVTAKGNSNTITHYAFTDAGEHAGETVYYRLKQMDVNGDFEYSATRVLKIAAAALKAYPNPSTGIFNLTTNADVRLFDVTGRTVIEGRMNEINLEGYTPGMYYLMINSQEVQKLILR